MTNNPFSAYPLDPYIIAEIGVNHEGSMARAKRMIESVARAGGHAAKFQTYKAGLLASKSHSPAYWDTSKETTSSQHELFTKFDEFGPAEYAELAAHCATMGIDFMSTPFDMDAVDMLAPLVPWFKVASADLTNVPLLRKIARSGKPVIMSVGASTHEEIHAALATLQAAGASQVAILHCVLRYPTPPEIANISAIRTLIAEFGAKVPVGYSDHVAPSDDGTVPSLVLAVAHGATILEKHFTDDRHGSGNDHYHAFDEDGLARFTRTLAEMRILEGTGTPNMTVQDAAITNARRRIFMRADATEGTVLTESELIPLRANVGTEIIHWDDIVGSTLRVAKKAGDPVMIGEVYR